MADPDTALHALLRLRRGHGRAPRAAPRGAPGRDPRRRDAGQIMIAGPLGDPPHGAAIVFAGRGPRVRSRRFATRRPVRERGLVTGRRHRPLERLVVRRPPAAVVALWLRASVLARAGTPDARGYPRLRNAVPADPPAPAARDPRAPRPGSRDEPQRRRTSSTRCSSPTASTAASRSRRCPASTACRSPTPSRRPARPHALGIPAVLLFGLPAAKDEEGSGAWDDEGIVQLATRAIKEAHPDLLVITDLCLCEYTSHGHCGVVRADGARRQRRDARAAGPHRRLAGPRRRRHHRPQRHDGRPRRARSARALDDDGLTDTPILAYSAKFASAFYGPFREAADSAPAFGDRRGYQMDPGQRRRGGARGAARRRGGRRHRDGQAGAPVPRRHPPGQGRRRRCRWPPTTSAASTRWSRRPPPPATSTSARPCSRR